METRETWPASHTLAVISKRASSGMPDMSPMRQADFAGQAEPAGCQWSLTLPDRERLCLQRVTMCFYEFRMKNFYCLLQYDIRTIQYVLYLSRWQKLSVDSASWILSKIQQDICSIDRGVIL